MRSIGAVSHTRAAGGVLGAFAVHTPLQCMLAERQTSLGFLPGMLQLVEQDLA